MLDVLWRDKKITVRKVRGHLVKLSFQPIGASLFESNCPVYLQSSLIVRLGPHASVPEMVEEARRMLDGSVIREEVWRACQATLGTTMTFEHFCAFLYTSSFRNILAS